MNARPDEESRFPAPRPTTPNPAAQAPSVPVQLPPIRTQGTPYDALIAKGRPWSWIWQYNGTPVSDKTDLHVLDGFDHSAHDFQYVVRKGSFPVAYFSCSFEDWRPDAKDWQNSDKGSKMSGWDERWPAPAAIKNHDSNIWRIYRNRLAYLANKMQPVTGGVKDACGVEWDNVDLYDSIKLGRSEGLRFLRHLKAITEEAGFVFVLKNSVEIIDDLPGVKLYVNESGQRWNEIQAYRQVGLTAPVLNVEYQRPKSSPPYVYTIYYPNQNIINGKAIVIR